MNIRISSAVTGTLLLFSYAAFVSGCASTPDINSAYDDGADFSQYRTYNFFSDAGADGQNYQSLFTQYMIIAIEREMESRGYQKSEQPDLLVNFNANFQDKTKVTTSPSSATSALAQLSPTNPSLHYSQVKNPSTSLS